MRIERLNKCCGSRGNLSAVDFQPHLQPTDTQRIATSGGTYVQIWSLSKHEDKGSLITVKCVLLFTFKEHSPYDVTTIRWSPNGQFLASTDSGGITNILKRNEKKTKIMESIIKSKLLGEPLELQEQYKETSQIKKYTIKYDGTEQNKKNNTGVQRITLTSKNVQIESKEIKSDNLNLLNHDNLEGHLETWETLTSISCPNNMGQLFDISWAPDNRSIIGGGMNGHVIVFDIYTKEIVAKFDALENSHNSTSGRGYIKSVSWDPMTLFVAVQSSNKEISIWRRSPPLPPGSPMKWTFKRVMYTDHFSEKSNTDVLGGSRLSWAPNGKNVVFPNSCFNNHNFSTCYQIQHNTTSFSHLFTKENYDKNQAQYHFDTMEHQIDLEPVLLKGHNSRIRNVRFSNDIMKSTQSDASTPNNEKYLFLAQSSDDNMLSVWRFKVNQECIVSVECICVLKNLLDEQSSIEDLAWGDFGRCLAVASSQGGLILIQFNYEEMGSKFYTNRIQGMKLNEMNQPPYEFFDYSEYVNSLAEDPNNTSKQNSESNNTNGIKTKTMTDISQKYNNNKINTKYNIKPYGDKDNIIYNGNYENKDNITNGSYGDKDNIMNTIGGNKNDMVNSIGRNKDIIANSIYWNKDIVKEFLIFCYRIYIFSMFWRMQCDFSLLKAQKRQLNFESMYNITFCNTFYVFSFTIEPESKLNQPRKKQKVSKKPKPTPVLVECITDIWLDMDYGSGNTMVTRYWNESENGLENKDNNKYMLGDNNNQNNNNMNWENRDENNKENKNIYTNNNKENKEQYNKNNKEKEKEGVENAMNVYNQDVESSVDKPARVSRVTRPDRIKVNRSGSSSNMIELCSANGLNELSENMFSYPVLRQSLSVSSGSRKYLGVNFLSNNNSRTFTSSLALIDEVGFKVFWIRYLNKGYITHIDAWDENLVVVSQKLEGYSKSYLTVMNANDGQVYVDELELGSNTVSTFRLLLWNNTYFALVTTNLMFGLYKYKWPNTVTQVLKFDLSYVARDNILKLEVVNSSLNYKIIFDQKLKENKNKKENKENNKNNKEKEKKNNKEQYNKRYNKEENEEYNKNKTKETEKETEENLVLVLYKKNNTVSIYSREYRELELNLELLSYSNKSLCCEMSGLFNMDTLYRFYNDDVMNFSMGSFSQVEFDGSLSKVIQSFTDDFQLGSFNENNNKENKNNTNKDKEKEELENEKDKTEQEKKKKHLEEKKEKEEKLKLLGALKIKLQVFLLLGSVWEYLLHLYEYVKILFQVGNVQEVMEFTVGMYKTILRLMNEKEHSQVKVKLDEVKVYDFGNYWELSSQCLLLMRSVVVPKLNLLYRKFQEDLGVSLESFDEFELLDNKSSGLVGFDNRFLKKFSVDLEYQDNEKSELLEVCLVDIYR